MTIRESLSELSRIGPAVKQVGAWTKRVLRGPVLLGKVLLSTTLVLVAIVAAINLSDLVRLPFYPFATEGAIYVDSPEVYTRERLVNDRYDQDHWLRTQLDKLDTAENLLTGTRSRSVNASLSSGAMTSGESGSGGDAAKPGSQDPRHPGPDAPLQLPFDQEFRIRSGVRDTIRQLLLENMLDDRHDLTGNSIYGLKFDTTVIPGVNTHKRAFVRVSVAIEPMFETKADQDDDEAKPYYETERENIESNKDNPPSQTNAGTENEHVKLYYERGEEDIDQNKYNKLNKPWKLYKDWLGNIEFRLNNYISRFYKSDVYVENFEGCRGIAETLKEKRWKTDKIYMLEDVAWNALEVVLGMERPSASAGRETDTLDSGDEEKILQIREPWSRFMQIKLNSPKYCEELRLSVSELKDTIYLAQKGESLPKNYWSIDVAGDDEEHELIAYVGNKFGRDNLTEAEFAAISPHYKVDKVLVLRAKEHKVYETKVICPPRVQEDSAKEEDSGEDKETEDSAEDKETEICDPERHLQFIIVPSGFFNFIEKIKKEDYYSYSIFPRQDVIGMLTDESISSDLSRAGAWVRVVQGLRRAATSSALVGYGDGSSLEKKRVEFGWVVARNEGMEPVQKAQLALVSVPAWTDELLLDVNTGWLDRDSKEQVPKTVHMKVPLPPYYEAFDSFIESNQLRRQPKILNAFLKNIDLEACTNARILIPGYRLWRSTTVTVGAQTADRIVVLPNMEGIIAEFKSVDVPDVQKISDTENIPRVKKGEQDVRAVRLRVWTSEGMDMAKKEVTIRVPDNLKKGRCPSLDNSAKG